MIFMKKVVAILLSVLCVLSCFTAAAAAIEDPGLIGMIEEDKPLLYCLVYKKETLSGVKMMYQPNPSVLLDGPGYVTVTNDVPLAVDHDLVCWKDKNGKLYYAGDKFYVDGECTLYAVWEDKTDNLIRPIRVFRCAMLTVGRLLSKALGIFKDIQDFNADRYEGTLRAVNAYNDVINAAKKEQNVTISKSSVAALSCVMANPVLAKDGVNEILDKYEYSRTESHTIKNGTTETGETASAFIRPYNEISAMTIDSNLVSGTVQDLDDGGRKIVLVLLKEDSSYPKYGELTIPERHAMYMDPLDLSSEPNLITTAELDYAKTTIRAVTDSEGRLVSWSITAPITGTAEVVVKSMFVQTEIEAVLVDEYKFAY